MAEILKGNVVAAALTEQATKRAAALREKGINPTLAVLRVGERGDDVAYENGAKKRCATVGVDFKSVVLPEQVTQQELLSALQGLNDDTQVHGILLMRPLPAHLDEEEVRRALAPEKDIDGITDQSLAGVFTGTSVGFAPCTAQACVELLDYYGIDPKGKRVTVIGRSLVVGKPVSMLLLARHATVTICHTRTVNLDAVCREADILIAAAGKAGVVGSTAISAGQTVLDVGVHVKDDGGLCGDVCFDEVQEVAGAITPVPGGIGAVTTSVLASHVVEAAERAGSAR